jgi:uncharacterized protein (DUF697 family)
LATKKKNAGLPINPKALLEAIGLIEEQSVSPLELTVLVDPSIDPALLTYAKEAFRPQTDSFTIIVTPYPDDGESGDTQSPFSLESTLVVFLAAEATLTGQLLAQARDEGITAVVVTLDPTRLQRIARDNHSEIDALSIVTALERVDRRSEGRGLSGGARDNKTSDAPDAFDPRQERFERLFAALGGWIVRELPTSALSLARALRFARDAFITNAIQATSLQNAAIAAVFFLPGADMPPLTLNQMKLFLKIAAVYDVALDTRRLRELAVLLLGGFGFRALARRLIGVVPVLGWAIRGGIGYAGTLAVGAAAREYFENGGDLKELMRGIRRDETTRNLT